MTNIKTIKALIPDYALGLLNPEQEKEVEAFLDSCESCQAELENYTSMFVAMVDSLPQLEPTTNFSELKQSVLFPSKTVETSTAENTAIETTEPFIEQQAKVNTGFLNTLKQLFTTWRYQSLSIALACGLALFSFWGWGQYQNFLDTNQTQVLVTQWLSRDRTVIMPITSASGENLGSLITDKNKKSALVILEQPPEKNKIYQAWGEVNKKCHPLAMSDSNIFEISWLGKQVEAIIVSSEPLGGSEETTDVVSKVRFF